MDTSVRLSTISAKAPHGATAELRLGQVPMRQVVELVSIDLPADQAEPLFERGILPGCRICPIRLSPSGDPIVEIDGALLALRKETAECLCVRLINQFQDAD
ncbi:MAG TPA: ferrous iron transport protein A [Gemmatimonadetes bacterium]|nr:ferrous iron transport protein A [Gemmatimonadota bacterium]